MSKEDINRRLIIWERMMNDPKIMAVAKGLILEMVGKLRAVKKNIS